MQRLEGVRLEWKKEHAILLAIFILTVSFRLAFALQTPEYSSPESYFVLRQVESIRETRLPLFEDSLSYGGRTFMFLPLFHYLLAGLSFILPEIVAFKVIPNLVASTIVIVTYLICRDLTKNREASLVAAFLSGFVPVYVSETTNTLSVYSFTVPLMFFTLYLFQLLHKDQRTVPWILGCILVLSFFHASVFLLVFGLIFYLILLKMEKMSGSRAEGEVVIFATFFITWLSFIIFKNVFLAHGPTVVWQNIPPQLLNQLFSQFDLIEAISVIGLLPFVFGLYAGYNHVVVERKRVVFLLFGFALAVFSLLGMRLLPLNIGLICLGFTLVVLFGQSYKLLLVTLSKSKIESYTRWIRLGLVILIIITAILPSATSAFNSLEQVPSNAELDAFLWLRENVPEDATVLATLDEGHYITALAKRPNAIDNNFLLVRQAGDRLQDVDTIFTTHSQTEAIRLLDKYDIDYIYVWGAREQYEIGTLPIEDDRCLVRVYPKWEGDSPVILHRKCTLQVER